jgi:Trypsin-like peptidase domain
MNQKRISGTGFVIYQAQDSSYVVTCAHVLDPPATIQVNERSASIVAIGHGWLDIAVLEVKGLEAKTPLKLDMVTSTGCSIKIPGISKLQTSNDVSGLRVLNGVLGEPLHPMSSSGQILVQAWDLRINEGEYSLREGYSGSPVIDSATGSAIAIVSHKAEKGEKGIAISIEALKEIWTGIPSAIVEHLEQIQMNVGVPKISLARRGRLERLEKSYALEQDNLQRLDEKLDRWKKELNYAASLGQRHELEYQIQQIEQQKEVSMKSLDQLEREISALE